VLVQNGRADVTARGGIGHAPMLATRFQTFVLTEEPKKYRWTTNGEPPRAAPFPATLASANLDCDDRQAHADATA